MQSPFMGRTERIESASQLLYPRYTSLSDAILVSSALVSLWALFLHCCTIQKALLPVQYPEGAAVPLSPPQATAGALVITLLCLTSAF